MNIIAITPFTGSEKLVAMTEDCIEQLLACELPEGVHLRVLAVNNKAARGLGKIGEHQLVDELKDDQNYGFGVGVNRGLDMALIGEGWPCDHVLVFNNDLQFPDRVWLTHLLREVEGAYVLSPRTDVTATVEVCQPGPQDKPAQRLREVSAFCWLVPIRVIKAIEARWNWPLFCPQFTNYGSDDATAAILRSIYGETPFKVVHRSFVKHLKARTANELMVKAGTKELLTDLRQWKSKNKLK
jgi:hypothetical protein